MLQELRGRVGLMVDTSGAGVFLASWYRGRMLGDFLQTLRAAISVAERAKNAELLGALNKAMVDAGELISANLELREANQQLRDRVRELEAKLAFSETLEFIHGLYHATDADGRVGEPFCPKCWEADRVAVHIHLETAMRGYQCSNCGERFQLTKRNPVLTRGHIDEGHATPNSQWNPDNKHS